MESIGMQVPCWSEKVVKDTVMSKELKVSGDNALRRLNVDEAARWQAGTS